MTVLLLLPSPVVQHQPGRVGETHVLARELPVPGISLLTFVLKLKVKRGIPRVRRVAAVVSSCCLLPVACCLLLHSRFWLKIRLDLSETGPAPFGASPSRLCVEPLAPHGGVGGKPFESRGWKVPAPRRVGLPAALT